MENRSVYEIGGGCVIAHSHDHRTVKIDFKSDTDTSTAREDFIFTHIITQIEALFQYRATGYYQYRSQATDRASSHAS